MCFWLAIAAGLAFAVLALCYKVAEHLQCRPAAFTLVFSGAAGVVSLGMAIQEPTAWTDPRLWGLGASTGLIFAVTIRLLLTANRLGPASVSWTMVTLSLLVPVLGAPFLFGEALIRMDWVILGLFLAMLACFAFGMHTSDETPPEHKLTFALIAVALFLINGSGLVLAKVKYRAFGDASSAGYVAVAFLVCSLASAGWHRRASGGAALRAPEWAAGLCAALASVAGNLLVLAAMSLPSAIVFPVSQGVSLLVGGFLLAACFREPLNGPKIVGLVLGFAVVVTAAVRQSL
jgi:hypothetical protein